MSTSHFAIHQFSNDAFEEHAIDTVHSLILNDLTIPMTFVCQTNDLKQILILYFMTEQSSTEDEINMIRAIMLLNKVERYIFACQILSSCKNNLNTGINKEAKSDLLFLHADTSGLKESKKYVFSHRKKEIKLSSPVESNTIKPVPRLDSLLSDSVLTQAQIKEVKSIIPSLPKNYPVKAFEYSNEINIYLPCTYK